VGKQLTNNNGANQGSKDFLLGAIIGGVVGAVTALWIAQKPGKEIRETFNVQTATMRNKAESFQKLAKLKVVDLAEITKDKTNSWTQSLSQQSSDLFSKLKDNNENAISSNEEELIEYIPIGDAASQPKVPSKINVTLNGDDRIQKMLSETKEAFDETERKLNQ
jgi:gas vesicle protein